MSALKFPLYNSILDTAPAKFLNLAGVVALVKSPTVGPKESAAALTPFYADGKTKSHAEKATYCALVQDHDDDNLTAENLRAIYDPLGCAWLAFTSASHQQEKGGIVANRWKVIIPLAQGIDADQHSKIANGLALSLGTDKAQARSQQVFYAPNKISGTAPYESIDETARDFLDPYDESHPLISAAVNAYECEQQERDRTARAAPPKPRAATLGATGGGIIEKVNAAYDLDGELQAHGYRKIGKAYLSPESTTGNPGVYILHGDDGTERVYSHHGETDPLSNLNHDGHALDLFDVLCILDYNGDVSRAVADLAPKVDPDGQKQSRRERRAAKGAEKVEAEFAVAVEADPQAMNAVDLFSNLELPPFPLEMLPEAIAGYAEDQAELIGVDPAVIAMAAIGAAAACIDDRLEIQPKRYDTGWREQPRLWVGIIGDPSAKKSPGISKAMGPLFKIDQQWREETARAYAEWLKACEDTPKGEEEPPAPIGKRLILNDATVEKMGDIMAKSEPRGILSYQDELSGWLASMDAYKNGAGGKDKAAWLEAYNGGPKAIDRVSRGSTFVENWSACVLGGIQPSVVQAYANATNHDGMLQRFVLVQAGEAQLGADRRPDSEARDRYYRVMCQLSEIEAVGGSVVTLSEGAHKAREALDGKLHRIIRSHPNKYLAAALGKWNGLYARLLLVFHCIECGDACEYPSSREVSETTAQQVADLMWKTLLPHAVKFYNGLDPVEDDSRTLAGLILARGWERFTVKRDLNRFWRASRKLKPWELEEILDRLEAFSWLFPDPGHLNEKGRPSAYLVNPGVHERFKAHAEHERERRKEVAAMIAELRE